MAVQQLAALRSPLLCIGSLVNGEANEDRDVIRFGGDFGPAELNTNPLLESDGRVASTAHSRQRLGHLQRERGNRRRGETKCWNPLHFLALKSAP